MLIGRLEQTITHNEKDVEKMENILFDGDTYWTKYFTEYFTELRLWWCFFDKKKVGALVNFLYQRESEVILGRLAQEGRGTCLIIWIKNGIPSF